jgi:hypothetical protein
MEELGRRKKNIEVEEYAEEILTEKEEYTLSWSQYDWNHQEQFSDEEKMVDEENGFGEKVDEKEYEDGEEEED